MSPCPHSEQPQANQRSAQYVTVLNCRASQRAGDTSGGCGIVYNRGTAGEETTAQVLHTDARATHRMWVLLTVPGVQQHHQDGATVVVARGFNRQRFIKRTSRPC